MSRLAVVAVLAVAVAGVAGAGWASGHGYGPFGRRAPATATAAAVPVTTAAVTSGTLTQSEQDDGTIGYAGSFTVYSAAAGTVTWLPASGSVIRPGQRLYAVDGQDTVLMRGQTPGWRAFVPGMTAGTDVAQLQRNLIALGYDPYRAITVDGSYDWPTQAAVLRWQAHQGWSPTAQIVLGQVAFLPGPLRVAAAAVTLGATVAPGTQVLGATSTTPVVTAGLPAQEQTAVAPGQRVTITLPDGMVAGGRVTAIGGPAASTGSGSAAGSGSAGGSGSGSGQGQPTVTVVASIDRPVTGLDGAPVQVAIATAVQRNALIVPISALLATPGAGTSTGYQVTVVTGASRHDVAVALGLFDDLSGTVAITGPGIGPGTRVVVPAS